MVELNEDIRVGLYDPALTSEAFVFEEEESLESVERMFEQITAGHDLELPQGFIEKTDKDPYLVYSDTDSVVGRSIVNINGKDQTIEDAWNKYGEILESNKEVKKITERLLTPSVDKNFNIQDKLIKHIIRHKTPKKLFRVTVYGEDENDDFEKSVCITEDHSIQVRRGDELITLTILEVQENDRLLYILGDTEM